MKKGPLLLGPLFLAALFIFFQAKKLFLAYVLRLRSGISIYINSSLCLNFNLEPDSGLDTGLSLGLESTLPPTLI